MLPEIKKKTAQPKSELVQRLTSFKYAIKGIIFMFTTQKNAWIHAVAAIVVISLGFVYKLTIIEWFLVIFSIGMVLMSEMFNTSLELLIDILSPEYQKKAGRVKDLAAGAVFVSALTSAIIGILIFIPKIFL